MVFPFILSWSAVYHAWAKHTHIVEVLDEVCLAQLSSSTGHDC